MKVTSIALFAHGVAVTPATATSAVLFSPLLSTVGVVLYERWQGSAANLNLWKCSFASLLFAGVVLCGSRAPLATIAEAVAPSHVVTRMLILSSFLGIVVGDLLWLQALKLLGARMTILQATLQPVLAAFAGALFLNQPLAPSTGLSVLAVCGGLALTQTAKVPAAADADEDAEEARTTLVSDTTLDGGRGSRGADDASRGSRRKLLLGSALNLLNFGFDTTGAVLTRRYGQGLTTWQINMVRFGSGALMTLLGLVAINVWSAFARPDEPSPEWASLVPVQPAEVWAVAACGALLVTFLSSALANYALFGLPLGIWSALSSLGPVWSIPVLYAVRRERTSKRAVLGAALAVTGAAACSMVARK